MKKTLILGLACTLLLTGCGGKKLTCTRSESESEMKMSEEIVFTFDKKGEKIQKGSFTMELGLDDEYIEYLDEIKKEIEEEFEEVNDYAEVEIKNSDKAIRVNVKYSVEDLNDEQKDDLYFENMYFEENYEEVKADFEEQGYTCK